MKRFIAGIILIAISLQLFLPSVFATEEPVFITIFQDRQYPYSVVPSGKDLLFSGKDLSILTGYEYQNDGKKAVFTRGMKKIVVDISEGVLHPILEATYLRASPIEVKRVGDTYLFSGSQLLPWLNVTCSEKNGALYIIADAVSIWDVAKDFDPRDFKFDFHKSCTDLGVSSKWLKASSYVRGKGFSMLFDAIPLSLDHTYGAYKDYFDIFDDMFQNKESSVYAVKELTKKSDKINCGFNMIEWLGELDNLPDELRAFAAFSKALSSISSATDYALYYCSFQQDNKEKLAIVDAIIGNRGVNQYPEAMVHACFDIADSYRNLWAGLETRLFQELTKESLKALVSAGTGKMMEGALKVIGMYKALKPDWVKGVTRISKYEAMAASGLNVYEDNFGGSHMYTIQLQRSHALLYLYACEQNWRTMADYAESKGKRKIANDYRSIADGALLWQGKFLASSLATMGDSHEYGEGRRKEEYTEELRRIFSKLDKAISPVQGSVPLEEIEAFIIEFNPFFALPLFNNPNDLSDEQLIIFLCDWVRYTAFESTTDTVSAAELEQAAYEVFGPNIRQIRHSSIDWYHWNPDTRQYVVNPMGFEESDSLYVVDSWETNSEYFVDVVVLTDVYDWNDGYDLYDEHSNHLGYFPSYEALERYIAALDFSKLPQRRYTITKLPDGGYYISKVRLVD